MTMTRDIGALLIAIDNATTTVFGDDACITHIVPSSKYHDEGTLLDVTISVFRDRYNDNEYEIKMGLFDELVYNPVFNSARTLSKVDIFFKEL